MTKTLQSNYSGKQQLIDRLKFFTDCVNIEQPIKFDCLKKMNIEGIHRFRETNGKSFLLIEGPAITDLTLLTCESVMVSCSRVMATYDAILDRLSAPNGTSKWLYAEMRFVEALLFRWIEVMNYRGDMCHVVSAKNVWRVGNAIEAICKMDRLIDTVRFP